MSERFGKARAESSKKCGTSITGGLMLYHMTANLFGMQHNFKVQFIADLFDLSLKYLVLFLYVFMSYFNL